MGVFNSVWHKVSGRERDWRAVKVSHWVGGLWVSGVGIGFALSREAPGLGWGNWSCSSSWEAWGSSLSSIPPLLPPPTHTPGICHPSLRPQLQFLSKLQESGSAFVQLPEGRKQTPVTAEIPPRVSADLLFLSSRHTRCSPHTFTPVLLCRLPLHSASSNTSLFFKAPAGGNTWSGPFPALSGPSVPTHQRGVNWDGAYSLPRTCCPYFRF